YYIVDHKVEIILSSAPLLSTIISLVSISIVFRRNDNDVHVVISSHSLPRLLSYLAIVISTSLGLCRFYAHY
ncbi:MAG TPA: hypothetical protein VI278_08825, partial [Nitrososphaeraceae archaeon]